MLLPDGKAHKRYEFGGKVGVVASLKKPFILAAHALPGRPYDGHTLMRSLAQANLNTGVEIKTAVADKDYRGHETWPGAKVLLPRQRNDTQAERCWRRTRLRRRSVIEALIGHMKVDGLMDRNWLKGTPGDAMRCVRSCARPVRTCACERSQLFAPKCTGAAGVASIGLLVLGQSTA